MKGSEAKTMKGILAHEYVSVLQTIRDGYAAGPKTFNWKAVEALDWAISMANGPCDRANESALSAQGGGWLPIEMLVCDDSDVLMWFNNRATGRFGPSVINADHDSDASYWRRGFATHWKPITPPTARPEVVCEHEWMKQNEGWNNRKCKLCGYTVPLPVRSAGDVDATLTAAIRDGIAEREHAKADFEKVCTCPSGDGSLRWPCPLHPSESQGGSAAEFDESELPILLGDLDEESKFGSIICGAAADAIRQLHGRLSTAPKPAGCEVTDEEALIDRGLKAWFNSDADRIGLQYPSFRDDMRRVVKALRPGG